MPRARKALSGSVIENTNIAVGALAVETAVAGAGPTMVRGGTIISSTITALISNRDAGDPPLLLVLARKALSTAHVLEFLLLDGPTFPEETPAGEQATRGKDIRVVGLVGMYQTTESVDIVLSLFLRNERIRLAFGEDDAGWNWLLFNPTSTIAVAAGSTCDIYTVHYVEWRPQS